MTKKRTQSKEQELLTKLEALEDRTNPENTDTAKGFVYRHFDAITQAKAKGYKWSEIAELFIEGGYKLKGSTLSFYYRSVKKERGAAEQKAQAGSKRQAELAKKKEEQRKPEARTKGLG